MERTPSSWKGHPAHPVLFVFTRKTNKFWFAVNCMWTIYGWRSTVLQSCPHVCSFGSRAVRRSDTLVYTRLNTSVSTWYTVKRLALFRKCVAILRWMSVTVYRRSSSKRVRTHVFVSSLNESQGLPGLKISFVVTLPASNCCIYWYTARFNITFPSPNTLHSGQWTSLRGTTSKFKKWIIARITFAWSVTYILHFTRVTIRIILIKMQWNLNRTVSQVSQITDVDFVSHASHSSRTQNQCSYFRNGPHTKC